MNSLSDGAQLRASIYRTIWRWHFYAGLFVLPFILILSLTGAVYLFKPQIDRWEEKAFRNLPMENAVTPNVQLEAALKANPGSQFYHYRLPENTGDAAAIHIALADGKGMRDIYVSPQGQVLGSVDPESRISTTIAHIHGTLLAGRYGSWLVELAASWAFVMILTGLYLWWPQGQGFAGVLWPRLSLGKRAFWRDLHAVTGFWVSGLALVLLITALPWANVWGDALKLVRNEIGWVKEKPDWKIAGEHAEHDHQSMLRMRAAGVPMTGLSDIVAKAKAEKGLPYPVLVKPPGGPDRGGPTAMVWTVKSEAQNRPLNQTITFDMATGKELSRKGIGDKHIIDQAVNYGIAWHEGQLFGWVNQLIGLLTAMALVTLAVSGFILWRKRKPVEALGAPPVPAIPAKIGGVVSILLLLAALLPLLAASLILLWFFDRLILPRLPKLGRWLGASNSQIHISKGISS
jgi:uncharacterized iron-regulated membrane protein